MRNPGTELRLDWVPTSLGEHVIGWESADLALPEPVPPDVESHRLTRAVRLLDLTTLRQEDTVDSVSALCARACRPLSPSPPGGALSSDLHVAAVCVFDRFVSEASEALRGTDVRVAAVTAGFPEPYPSQADRLQEVRGAVAAGADEVDVVITIEHVLDRDWGSLYGEVQSLRDACGGARLKTILRAGLADGLDVLYRASLVSCMAGADFIKTSTGLERVNATLPIGRAMASAIRTYAELTGHAVGLKPAGGIRTAEMALSWLQLTRQELGEAWIVPDRLRIGASSLLGAIQARLNALATDR